MLTTQVSLFYTFDFSIGTHSFLLEPGILIRKQRSTPFFRKLHYSFFTDTLFGSVPFTFQAGVNQDGQPVFFLSAVSRLSHRPEPQE
ncbi:MAG: hypothetical protein ACTTJ7_08010 [Treponema sp.]